MGQAGQKKALGTWFQGLFYCLVDWFPSGKINHFFCRLF